ncbi:MAG: SMI1/KNR4 family protein [Planctomycetota bacterium]
MAVHSNDFVPPFSYPAALKYSAEERMLRCVDRVKRELRSKGLWDLHMVPPVPDSGASEEELRKMELELGVALPSEYRSFLQKWKYLIIDDGLHIWGFKHKGLSIGSPWVSDKHRRGVRYLVFGYYWGFADGDQLMYDLSDPKQSVVAYLHEHGPSYESFAPSFSLALWRMVEEWANREE